MNKLKVKDAIENYLSYILELSPNYLPMTAASINYLENRVKNAFWEEIEGKTFLLECDYSNSSLKVFVGE